MDIKMRTTKSPDVVCKVCGATKQESLEIFEIRFTDKAKITICDLCNNKLLYKTLKASCMINERVKSKEEITILNKRNLRKTPTWYFDKKE